MTERSEPSTAVPNPLASPSHCFLVPSVRQKTSEPPATKADRIPMAARCYTAAVVSSPIAGAPSLPSFLPATAAAALPSSRPRSRGAWPCGGGHRHRRAAVRAMGSAPSSSSPSPQTPPGQAQGAVRFFRLPFSYHKYVSPAFGVWNGWIGIPGCGRLLDIDSSGSCSI
jgi:hypothetical protein